MLRKDQILNYTVKSEKYISKVRSNPYDLTFMQRQQSYNKPSNIVDAFGPLWFVGFSQVSDQSISVRHAGELVPLKGTCGFFAPAYSIMQWHIQAGVYNWSACTSHLDLPSDFYQKPFLFTWDGKHPNDFKSLIKMLTSAENKLFIHEQNINSALSNKVKNYLDTHYLHDASISQIAKEFGYS